MSSKGEDVGNGITAKTVSAMNPACDFAGSIQPGNGFTILVQSSGKRIDAGRRPSCGEPLEL